MLRLASAMTISIMLPLVRLWVRYRNPPLPLPTRPLRDASYVGPPLPLPARPAVGRHVTRPIPPRPLPLPVLTTPTPGPEQVPRDAYGRVWGLLQSGVQSGGLLAYTW